MNANFRGLSDHWGACRTYVSTFLYFLLTMQVQESYWPRFKRCLILTGSKMLTYEIIEKSRTAAIPMIETVAVT